MARMIDADVLLDHIKDLPTWWANGGGVYGQAMKYPEGMFDVDDIVSSIENAPTLTQPNGPLATGFDVVDTKTGEYPDLEKIALKEDWAKHLMYCDMEGFAIEEDGTLLLLDECGRQACCPVGRFEIRRPPEGEEEI